MTKPFILIGLIFLCELSSAQNKPFNFYTDSLKLKNDNNAIIADFENMIKKIDNKFEFKGMKTIIINNAPTGYYLPTTNNIYLPMWQTMPQMFKDFGTSVTGSKEKGEELSRLFFYGFFLPHEIGHGLQHNAKKLHNNEYDNEYEANVIAVLYWRKQGKKTELTSCYKIAKLALKNLTDPIPKGEDPKSYFTNHYEEFTNDPNKYAYIMFEQVVIAYEDKTLPDFDNYIKRILSRK